uniref:DNA-directed RNA polymerase n=1 Tax=viral metagenome TaxID=1070528 RepID=A0A6C0KE36_9ZZZZ
MINEEFSWKFIDTYFKNNPNHLVNHHLNSFNDFYDNGLKQIFREYNPMKIVKNKEKNQCFLYFGGKKGNKIYYGKPIIYDEPDRVHFMYPNEARLRNMTYGISIHYDIDVDFIITNDDETTNTFSITLKKIFLGRFPIMLQSNLCILKGLLPEIRYNMGECRNDPGGYFIIDGKEKVIISQEKFADNMLYIRDKVDDTYNCSAEIRSVSEDASKPTRSLWIRRVAPSPTQENGQIVVNVPNVRKPIPLFILMRALGIISDKDIILHCLLDIKENKGFMEFFRASVYDAGYVFTQEAALKYIATLTKGKTVNHTMLILMNYLLPHLGELNLKQKALYIGHMVMKLLKVYTKVDKPTDRDSFKFKRIEITGTLLYGLFKEYYNLQMKHIFTKIDKEYYYHENSYQTNFLSLIESNFNEYFKERLVENGIRKAFKGNWGSQEHTKRAGVIQTLDRLSFNSFIAQLRKVNLPFDSNAKVVAPRLLHGTQWGIIDPVDTPDGGNIGFHKNLSIMTHITSSCSSIPFIEFLKKNKEFIILEECNFAMLHNLTKVFVNGNWIGMMKDPRDKIDELRLYRRNGIIPTFISVQWNKVVNEILIATDAGRPCRPLIYIANGEINYERPDILEKIKKADYTWNDLVLGFSSKKNDLYSCSIEETKERNLEETAGIIEYLDTEEAESALIAIHKFDYSQYPATHIEIHPSLLLGVMGNQIVFPENNQLPRNLFSCGQSKQAVSLYNTNFHNRIDTMGVVLNNGQIPLVKTRYLKYINKEQMPYGENAIVAIMCYTGYNVEDAVLINQGSLNRGIFRTTYYKMYETHEESSSVSNTTIDSKFLNIDSHNVIGKKPGYDYSELNEHGMIKENTFLNDKMILIGKAMNDLEKPDTYIDQSVYTKKGQTGFVDKTFITDGEEGFRIGKIRIREERIPAIGDKICSRCGQKGTIGLVIPESDMPYADNGIKPDLIINPHALPSRMTIGQLIESLMGKACALYGGFGDCTAFVNKGPKNELYGSMLTKMGYHYTGNEVLYNGMTGDQLETEIFMGPTYYMRLKHMVKDKINYRARGPRTALTRQTVQGRSNDGGLRIGEMERDGLIAHGMTGFIVDSMLERGDEFYMAVCNQTGTIAIYNENQNLFLSPMSDGPIKFIQNLDSTLNIDNISRFGRNFSIVRVPYTFKLLLQELKTMNIQMHIITEDNVDQLLNLSYSESYKEIVSDTFLSNIKIKSSERETEIENEEDNLVEEPIEETIEDEDEDDEEQQQEEEEEEEQQEQQQEGGSAYLITEEELNEELPPIPMDDDENENENENENEDNIINLEKLDEDYNNAYENTYSNTNEDNKPLTINFSEEVSIKEMTPNTPISSFNKKIFTFDIPILNQKERENEDYNKRSVIEKFQPNELQDITDILPVTDEDTITLVPLDDDEEDEEEYLDE